MRQKRTATVYCLNEDGVYKGRVTPIMAVEFYEWETPLSRWPYPSADTQGIGEAINKWVIEGIRPQ